MAQRRDRRAGSLLDALPTELRADASPEACWCRCCEPLMSAVERERHEAVAREWNAARKSWCNAHGVTPFELMLAERIRAAPSKQRGKTPVGTRRPGEPNSIREK